MTRNAVFVIYLLEFALVRSDNVYLPIFSYDNADAFYGNGYSRSTYNEAGNSDYC